MDIFLLSLFIVICVLLIVVVLLQKGRGGGLSAAFGGGMTSSAFGTRTGDVFTWVTIVLTSLFLLLAIASTYRFRPRAIDLYPQFSPPSGPIEVETPVTIAAPHSRDELTVRYTLNGSDPTEKSPQYLKQAVTVKPGQTLKARIWRRGKEMPVAGVFYGRPDQYPKETPLPTTATAPTSASAPAATSGPETPASAPAGSRPSAPRSLPAPVSAPASAGVVTPPARSPATTRTAP